MEALMMFHYVLEMHKDGKELLRMELNVPVESFPAVEQASFVSLHRMLVDYGVRQGYTKNTADNTSEALAEFESVKP